MLGACSGNESSQGAGGLPISSTAAVEPTTSAAPLADAVVQAPAADPAPAATPVADAPALLQAALGTLGSLYHFSTHVTLDGAEVLVAEGDRVADGTRLTIWSNDTSVAYVITPTGSWVFPDGGEWQALDDAPAATDPLDALRAATTVTGTAAADGTTTTLVATVPAVSLGITGDGTADVQLQLTGSTLSEVSYSTTFQGAPAIVRSTLSGVVDATPVVAPI